MTIDSQTSTEIELAERTEILAKQAMQLGLVPSFAVHYFPDSWRFYIPDLDSEPLTPERAYLHLQRVLSLTFECNE